MVYSASDLKSKPIDNAALTAPGPAYNRGRLHPNDAWENTVAANASGADVPRSSSKSTARQRSLSTTSDNSTHIQQWASDRARRMTAAGMRGGRRLIDHDLTKKIKEFKLIDASLAIDHEGKLVSVEDEVEGTSQSEVMDNFLSAMRASARKHDIDIDFMPTEGKEVAALSMPLEFRNVMRKLDAMYRVDLPDTPAADNSAAVAASNKWNSVKQSVAAFFQKKRAVDPEAGRTETPDARSETHADTGGDSMPLQLLALEFFKIYGATAINPENLKLVNGYHEVFAGIKPDFVCDDHRIKNAINQVLDKDEDLRVKVACMFGSTALKSKDTPTFFGEDRILDIPGAPKIMGEWGQSTTAGGVASAIIAPIDAKITHWSPAARSAVDATGTAGGEAFDAHYALKGLTKDGQGGTSQTAKVLFSVGAAGLGGFINNFTKLTGAAGSGIAKGLSPVTDVIQGVASAVSMPVQVHEFDAVMEHVLWTAFKPGKDGYFNPQVCLRYPNETGEISEKQIGERIKLIAKTLNNNLGSSSSVKGSAAMLLPFAGVGTLLNFFGPSSIGLAYQYVVQNAGEVNGAKVNHWMESTPLGTNDDIRMKRASRDLQQPLGDVTASSGKHLPVIAKMRAVDTRNMAEFGTFFSKWSGVGPLYNAVTGKSEELWKGRPNPTAEKFGLSSIESDLNPPPQNPVQHPLPVLQLPE